MANDSELTDREILERMREHVNSSQGGGTNVTVPLVRSSRQFAFIADKGVPGYHLGRLRQDVEVVYQLQSTVGTINPRPAGLVNEAIQFSKRMLARVLSWYTRPLQQFQAAVARAFEEQLHALESLQNQVNTSATMNQQRSEAIEEDVQRLVRQQERFASLSDRNEILKRGGLGGSSLQQLSRRHLHSSERQRTYLPFFENKGPVWDLAAGDGRFLEMLRDSHIPCQGVESDLEACGVCRGKGLQVKPGEVFDFLQNSGDSSAGGIFASGVLEHLSPELQLRLIDLCRQKLKPGAPLVIETFNPECLSGVASFFVDPTNVRPVHQEYLRVALESKGFGDVKVRFIEPVEGAFLEKPDWSAKDAPEALTKALMNLNNAVFGCQFYAVTAWRS